MEHNEVEESHLVGGELVGYFASVAKDLNSGAPSKKQYLMRNLFLCIQTNVIEFNAPLSEFHPWEPWSHGKLDLWPNKVKCCLEKIDLQLSPLADISLSTNFHEVWNFNFPWSVYLVETQTVFLVVVSLHPKSKTSLPSHQTIPVTERSHNPYLVCRNFNCRWNVINFGMLKVDERCQTIPFSFNLSRFFLQETSDLTFMIEGKPVYVHKAMLKIR